MNDFFVEPRSNVRYVHGGWMAARVIKATIMLLFALLAVIAHAALVSAGQFDGQGVAWATQACSHSYNLCHQPFLLGLSAGIISSLYFLQAVFRRTDS